MKHWILIFLFCLILLANLNCGYRGGGGDEGDDGLPLASIEIRTEPVAGEIILLDFKGNLVGQGTGYYKGWHPISQYFTVNFGEVQNYLEPDPETFTLTPAGFSKIYTYTYEEIPTEKAFIEIKTEPVAGSISIFDSNGNLVGQGTGYYKRKHPINKTYTVKFGPVALYIKPSPETFTLTSAGFSKIYYYKELDIPQPPW